MIRRVVFFQPRTLAGDNYRTPAGCEQRWAPWAALVLAPIVSQACFDVSLIDARVNAEGWNEEVFRLGPDDLLAVSVMTGQAITDAVRASEIARDRGRKVVWGGSHVSLFPGETLSQAPVDAVVPGFGYAPLEHLVTLLRSGGWPSCSDGGVLARQAAGRLSLPVVGSAPHPAALPPSLDLVSDWEPYINPDVAIATRTVNFVTSEGCTRRCTYCSEPQTSGSRILARDAADSVAVAKDLCDRSGANGLKLHDPNFFDDMGRALGFACRFATAVGLPWAATMHPADLAAATDGCLAELARHGLSRLLVGLESPDAKIIKLAGKQYDPSLIPGLTEKLARSPFRTSCFEAGRTQALFHPFARKEPLTWTEWQTSKPTAAALRNAARTVSLWRPPKTVRLPNKIRSNAAEGRKPNGRSSSLLLWSFRTSA
jgi:radical SAM superfamily enzyme YgiQ (UPF0313 family)